MQDFIGHISDPTQINDYAFGIYVGERRVFGSPDIACALNLWRFAKTTPWFSGHISIRNDRGEILYNYFKTH